MSRFSGETSVSRWTVLFCVAGFLGFGGFSLPSVAAKSHSNPFDAQGENELLLQGSLGEEIEVYDEHGELLGNLDGETVLKVYMSRSHAQAVFTPDGFNPSAVRHFGPLVRAYMDTQSRVGSHIRPSGSEVWIPLSELIQEGRIHIMGFQSPDEELTDLANDLIYADFPLSLEETKGLMEGQASGLGRSSDPNEPLYYDLEALLEMAAGGYGSPTCSCAIPAKCRITSRYGPRKSKRTRNGRKSSSYHRGIDFGGGSGTTIVAVKAGCVDKHLTNKNGGYGLTVYLKHSDGTRTHYSHLRRITAWKGCLRKGQKVGEMGMTGNSTGPHLHLGLISSNGNYTNPNSYFNNAMVKATRGRCANP